MLYCVVLEKPTDVVNTGARLAVQAAKLGLDHLCTEEVRDAAAAQLEEGHTISMSHAGKVKLKGKQGETAVYVSQHDVSRHSFSSNHARTPPKHRLVGREPELRRLMELLEGTGKDIRMALLDGVAGVGKSALVQSALYALKHDKRPTLQVHCSYEDQTPFITCQNVLKWMLELEGEPEAANFAWIMVRLMGPRICVTPSYIHSQGNHSCVPGVSFSFLYEHNCGCGTQVARKRFSATHLSKQCCGI
jgi:hypothetical protein